MAPFIPGVETCLLFFLQEVLCAAKLKTVVEDYVQEYNNTLPNPMQLVMFGDACGHVARICRVLRQPSGHALLLGVRGSGRQSLSRLASFIMEMDCFQIEATKGPLSKIVLLANKLITCNLTKLANAFASVNNTDNCFFQTQTKASSGIGRLRRCGLERGSQEVFSGIGIRG